MIEIKRKFLIDSFLENTSIHGLAYLNSRKKIVKIMFICLISVSVLFVLTSTGFYLLKYLEFDSYIIKEENEINSFDELPGILICPGDKLSLLKSIIDLQPEFNDTFNLIGRDLSSSSMDSFGLYSSIKKYKMQNLSYMNRKIDYDFMKYLKGLKKLPLIRKCQIEVQGEIIDCTNAESQVVFNLNGFCLLDDLTKLNLNHSKLDKVNNILNYEDDYKVKINIIMDSMKIGNIENLYYFYLLNPNDLVRSFENPVITDGMPLNFYNSSSVIGIYTKHSRYVVKNYEVSKLTTKYSSSLNNQKCLSEENYNQNYCHFQCLGIIIKELLGCDFILNPFRTGMSYSYCSVADLYVIEEIIKMYSIIRKDFNKKCNNCLPNCESTVFKIKEFNFDSIQTNSFDLVLNLYLNYKTIKTSYNLEIELAQLLNYTAGFFSLCFGISFLSIFEIIELLYGLILGIKFQNKLTRLNLIFERIFQSKTYENLKIIFQDSEIHGVSQFFSGRKRSVLSKLIWLFILSFSAIGLSYSISDAIEVYLRYDSDIITSYKILKHEKNLLNRSLTAFICSPSIPKDPWKNISSNLINTAEELFKNSNDLKNITEIYKDSITQLTGRSQLFSNYENASSLFLDIFDKCDYDISFYSIKADYELDLAFEGKQNFDKFCQSIETGITISKLLFDETDIYLNEKLICDERSIFFLDSKSMHFSKSLVIEDLKTDEYKDNIYFNFKKKLPSPYRSSCNSNVNYFQHHCLHDCFNNIIYDEFGCKVIFYETKNDSFSSYCHPLLVPLISSFKKYILSKNKSLCNHCKEPCEVYYYNTNLRDFKHIQSSFILHDMIKTIEEVETRTLYQTFIISMSFFGLFFGCNLLNLIQIPYNISKLKTRKSLSIIKKKKQELNPKIKDFFHKLSKFKSINCSKYFSTVNQNYEKVKTYFWFFTILLTLLFSLFLSFQEIMVYSNSKQAFILTESKDNFHLPKIDFCNEKIYQQILKNPYKQYKTYTEKLLRRSISFNNFDKIFSKHSSSVIERIKLLYANNETKVLFINEEGDDFKNKKFTDLYDKEALVDIKLMNEVSDNSLNLMNDYKPFNLTVRIFHTSLLYSDDFIQISHCKTVNWSFFNRSESSLTNDNPFFKLPKNQISFTRKNIEYYRIFFENNLLMHSESSSTTVKVNSFIINRNSKHRCTGDISNCISSVPVLEELTDYQLFLCNYEFQQLIYKTFNCTPFFSSFNNKHMNECPVKISLLIYETMSIYKEELMNCEFVAAKQSIESQEIFYFDYNSREDYTRVDFSDMKLYEEKLKKNGQIFIELIVNIANYLSLCIGFSIFTIYELVYILRSCIFKNKVHANPKF
jgi:hypothetical protein